MSRKTSSNSKGRTVLIHDVADDGPLYVLPSLSCLEPTQSPWFSGGPNLLHEPSLVAPDHIYVASSV